jgi:hypothetical protein
MLVVGVDLVRGVESSVDPHLARFLAIFQLCPIAILLLGKLPSHSQSIGRRTSRTSKVEKIRRLGYLQSVSYDETRNAPLVAKPAVSAKANGICFQKQASEEDEKSIEMPSFFD